MVAHFGEANQACGFPMQSGDKLTTDIHTVRCLDCLAVFNEREMVEAENVSRKATLPLRITVAPSMRMIMTAAALVTKTETGILMTKGGPVQYTRLWFLNGYGLNLASGGHTMSDSERVEITVVRHDIMEGFVTVKELPATFKVPLGWDYMFPLCGTEEITRLMRETYALAPVRPF